MTPTSSGNRHILITGASGGIGAAVTLALAGRATRLTLVARDPARLQALARQVEPKAAGVRVLAADLAATAHFEPLIAAATAEQGPIDVLVNGAGVNAFKRLADTGPDAIGAIVATNILAPMLLSRAVLPQMLARRRGRIVNIGSVMGGVGFAGFSAYCASKFAIRGFSEALRRELAGSGVAVTYVAPRYTRTALNSPAMDRMAKAVKMNIDAPEAVARAIVAAIDGGKAEHAVGFVERILIRANALFPRLVDGALASLNRRMLEHAE
ncbi:MAG TPA: SDR family oxidoreductase [Dongiaceae bacterium]|jgi:short-subunit dehydrogenase|nr:SDR family oxidoreductase [Dongiaceae bacterium]